jgi:TPR repeat protein
MRNETGRKTHRKKNLRIGIILAAGFMAGFFGSRLYDKFEVPVPAVTDKRPTTVKGVHQSQELAKGDPVSHGIQLTPESNTTRCKPNNIDAVRSLYAEACDLGDLERCTSRGNLELYDGYNTVGRYYFKKACDGKDKAACFVLKNFDKKLEGIAATQHWYAKICDEIGFEKCFNLANFQVEDGDIGAVRRWYTEICKDRPGRLGSGCFDLGQLEYETGNVPAARRHLEKACHNSNFDRHRCAILKILDYNVGNTEAARLKYGKSCGWSNTSGYDWANTNTCGGLGTAIVKQTVFDSLNRVRHCYEQLLTRGPEVDGNLEFQFVIAPNGQVSSSQLKNSTISDRKMQRCVESVIESLRFPARHSGKPFLATYPFVFLSKL